MADESRRKDMSGGELRALAARMKNANAARRMQAIALVREGANRTTVAETCGMDRQRLRDYRPLPHPTANMKENLDDE